MMTETAINTVTKIQAELDRLEVGEGWCSRHGMAGTGISVSTDDDLPEGWVRFVDSAGEPSYCDAEVALANLEEIDTDTDSAFEDAWEAIAGNLPENWEDFAANTEVVFEATCDWLEIARRDMEIDWESEPIGADDWDAACALCGFSNTDTEVGFSVLVEPRDCDTQLRAGDIIATSGPGGDVAFLRRKQS